MTTEQVKAIDTENAEVTLAAPRGRIYNGVLETIGATPLVRLPSLAAEENLQGDLLAKLEYFNPMGSVKDRIAYSMISEAEKKGKIVPGQTVIVEPTSGNTGIGLAMIAAAKGYKLILTMPESMSIERRKMLALLGAELYLTPKEEGMKGAINKADEIAKTIPHSFVPSQFENQDNPKIHRETTAQEIIKDTDGEAAILVSGVGTGGTLTGVSEVLKAHSPDFKTVAVEPADSSVLSGAEPGAHKIQGIGAGFVPEILDTSLIDEIVTVSNDEAFEMARRIARLEGLACGISSGAALVAGVKIAKRPENKDKQIVVIIPSFAERYLSTPLFDGLEV